MIQRTRESVAGWGTVIAGALWALNGFVSGPHAYGFGWYAVIMLVASGLFVVVGGVVIFKKRSPSGRG